MKNNKIKIEENIKRTLRKHPIVFAYLFGSYAKNEVLPFSDLDIAVYFDKNLNKKEKQNIISETRESLEKKLKMPQKIDIVCLNDELPPLLLKNIVYEGNLIYSKNEQKRMNWESQIISIWWDWEYYQKQFDEAILNTSRI